MLKKFIFIGVLIFCLSLPHSLFASTKPEDLYLQIYEQTKTEIGEKSLERVSKQSTLNTEDLNKALQGNFTPAFFQMCEKYFPKMTSSALYQCQNFLRENHEYEKKLNTLENQLQNESNSSEIWTDGSLENSFFDLLVDFQIIEIILFGTSDYDYPFENQNSSKLSDQIAFNTQDTLSGSLSINDNNLFGDADSKQKVCRDPEEIALQQKFWGSGPKNNPDIITFFEYQGGDYRFPPAKKDCSETSLFGGLLCLDNWPCNKFFCIKIGTEPQIVNGGGGLATSVQEIVTKGIEQLNYLKGHTLTIHRNSNERFMVSVSKFLSRPISLDVITQAIPIKLTPKKTRFDEETQTPLNKLRNKISEESGCLPEENGYLKCNDVLSSITKLETGELQTESWGRVGLDQEKLKQEQSRMKEAFKRSEKIKQSQSSWEELRNYLNFLAQYFSSIYEVILRLDHEGLEILNDTGQSCNSKR